MAQNRPFQTILAQLSLLFPPMGNWDRLHGLKGEE